MKRGALVYSKKSMDYLVEELRVLCKAADIEIICEVALRRDDKISGDKIRELKKCIESHELDVVIVEPELPPTYILKIEKETGREVIDRTQVILSVFEKNAGSAEAKLQIRVAQLRHVLPLLRERINLIKRGEMPGFMAGGIIATEKYYRHVRRMIKRLRDKLNEIGEKRTIVRLARRNLNLPIVSIVGFANAGKTTFFNTASGLRKETGDIPFTTLIPKSYRISIDESLDAILTDTVGFVFNAPPEIIEAFKSTLEEVVDSDIILFIIDSSEPLKHVILKLKEAEKILCRLGVQSKPVFLFFNKIDLLEEESRELIESLCNSTKELMINVIGCHAGSALSRDDVKMALERMVIAVQRSMSQRV